MIPSCEGFQAASYTFQIQDFSVSRWIELDHINVKHLFFGFLISKQKINTNWINTMGWIKNSEKYYQLTLFSHFKFHLLAQIVS